MCAVSAVTDYYREKWPINIPGYPDYTLPEPPPFAPLAPLDGRWITAAEWAEYQELKHRMEEYDAKTGQPDCIKPEVKEWEKIVVDVLIKRGIIVDRNNDI
jgi:hypothetical protein